MKITELIKMVDELYPNPYDDKIKYSWAYELSCIISEKVRKIYGRINYDWHEAGEPYMLPPGISFEDIESVFVDGHKQTKVDARSYGFHQSGQRSFSFSKDGGLKHEKVRLIYKMRPAAYKKVYIKDLAASVKDYDSVDQNSILKVAKDEKSVSLDQLKANDKITIRYDNNVINVTVVSKSITTDGKYFEIKTGNNILLPLGPLKISVKITTSGSDNVIEVQAEVKDYNIANRNHILRIKRTADNHDGLEMLSKGDEIKIRYADNNTLFANIVGVNKIKEQSGTYVEITTGNNELLPLGKDATIISIKIVMNESTLTPAAFDSMYIDYILAKVGYYQNDFEEYNKHMSTFNVKFDEFSKWYKQTNPVNQTSRFHL